MRGAGMRRLPYARPMLFGAAWLAVSLLFFRTAGGRHTLTAVVPVLAPIHLDRPGSMQASFTAGYTSSYSVHLDLKKKLPFEDLVAFMGGFGGSQAAAKSHTAPARPEIKWSVSGVRPEDQQQSWHDAYYGGDSVGLSLGHFEAQKGRQYTITVTVVKPSADIQVTDPHLQIELGLPLRDEVIWIPMIASMGGVISGFVATCLLLSGLVRWAIERRAHRASFAASEAE